MKYICNFHRILCVCLSLLMFFLSACSQAAVRESSAYISNERLPLSGITLKGNITEVAVHKNIAFTLNDEGSIVRRDIASGESAPVIMGSEALSIGCDTSILAVVTGSSIVLYDYDGNELKNIPFDDTVKEATAVAVGDRYAAFVSSLESGDEIRLVNIDSGNITTLSDEWRMGNVNAKVIGMTFSSDDSVCISYISSMSLAGGAVRAVEYDISSSEVTRFVEKEYLDGKTGWFSSDGEFYYLDYAAGQYIRDYYRTIVKVDKEGSASNYMLIDDMGLRKLGIKPQEVYKDDYGDMDGDEYQIKYADGENFVIWDKTAGTLAAFSSNDELIPLTLIVSDDLQTGLRASLTKLAEEFLAKTGRQLVIKYYPAENYNRNMLTKILARDSDFDLFMAGESLLINVMDSSAYEPLDGYEGVVYNFDNVYAPGVKEFMTAEGGILGIPWTLGYNNLELTDSSIEVSEKFTIDELFDLCGSIEGTGKYVFDNDLMVRFAVFNILDEMIIQNNEIDEEELAGYFAKFKEYYDKGVLIGERGGSILTNGFVDFKFDAGNYDLNPIESPDIITCPLAGDTLYLRLEKAILMNSSSENKEAAAEFLELLSGEDAVYSDTIYLHIGRDVTRHSGYEQLSDMEKEHMANSLRLFEGALPSRVWIGENITAVTDEILAAMLSGEMTPEEAAEEYSGRISIIYFE